MTKQTNTPFTKTQLEYLNKRIGTATGVNMKLKSYDIKMEKMRVELRMLRNDNKTLHKRIDKLQKVIQSMLRNRGYIPEKYLKG